MKSELIPGIIRAKLSGCSIEDRKKVMKQFLYSPEEDIDNEDFLTDPVGDKIVSIPELPCLLRKYKDRLLVIVNQNCNIFCRFCFRRNIDLLSFENCNKIEIQKYIQQNPEIQEIILSGGEPFLLNKKKISEILKFFLKQSNIQKLRVHTRAQWTAPSLFNHSMFELFNYIKQYFNKEITVIFHINHSCEIDTDTEIIANRFQQIGVIIKHQMVLLKGVNNSIDELKTMYERLKDIKIQPHYIHHPDRVLGASHFYLPIEEGKNIIKLLSEAINDPSMMPDYVIDSPQGKKKLLSFQKL